ncbi:nitroreductase family protein [Micromonosporaceae bacterium B7E4]
MTALARLADDVAVLVRDGDAVLLRDGAEVLHVPGAGPAAEWLAGWSTRPWPRRELAGAPTAVRHLLALLERHGAVLADPLTGHLLDLHGRTVGGHLELPAVPGADSAFLAREAGTGPIVRLPPPAPGAAPLGRALRNRRSAGRFGTGPVSLAVLGTLLGAGAGTTGTADASPETSDTAGMPAGPNGTADTHTGPNDTADTHTGPNGTAGAEPGGSTPGGGAGGVLERVGGAAGTGWAGPGRAYPSGGRLYPVETHVVAVRVAGLTAAGYRYLPLAHALSRRAVPTPATEPARWLPDLPPGDTAAVVLLTVDFARPSLARYGGKAYRLALLEAGQIAQNLLLLGTVLGVAGRPYCGYDEEAAAGAAGLAYPTETVVYAIAFGPTPDTPGGGRTAEPVPPDGRS